MDMTTKVLAFVAVLAPMILAGCRQDPIEKVPFQVPVVSWSDDGEYLPHRAGPGLVAQSPSPIPDVPMPIGFKAVKSQCSSSFDGVSRTVTHVYQGRAAAAETVLFYQQQLPLFDWEKVERQTFEDGSTSLHYTKGNEALGIRLSERHGKATIEIYMTPR